MRVRSGCRVSLALLLRCILLLILLVPVSARGQEVTDTGSREDLAQKREILRLQESIRFLFSQGKYEDALRECDALFKIDPNNPTAVVIKDRTERRLAQGELAPPSASVPSPTSTPGGETPPDFATGTTGSQESPTVSVAAPESFPEPEPLRRSAPPARDWKKIALMGGGGLLALILIVVVVVRMRSRRSPAPATKVPMVTAAAMGTGPTLAAFAPDPSQPPTQPGFFDFDERPDQMATRHDDGSLDEKTNVEPPWAGEKTAQLPVSAIRAAAEEEELAASELPTVPSSPPLIEERVTQENLEVASVPAVPVGFSEPLVAKGSSSGMARAPRAFSAEEGEPRSAPEPIRHAAPKPLPQPPIDIAAMLPPIEEPLLERKLVKEGAPASLDDPSGSLFGLDQTASKDPQAQSFNSLMFGSDSTHGEEPKGTDDLTMNSFNKEFSSVMLGAGAEETKSGANAGRDEDEHADPNEATLALSPSRPPAAPQADTSNEETLVIPAPQPAAGSSKASMFERQRDAGKEALHAEDYPRAVHCLSIAASLKPSDKEVRELLEEARRKRQA